MSHSQEPAPYDAAKDFWTQIIFVLILYALYFLVSVITFAVGRPAMFMLCAGFFLLGWVAGIVGLFYLDRDGFWETVRITLATLFYAALPIGCATVNYGSTNGRVDMYHLNRTSARIDDPQIQMKEQQNRDNSYHPFIREYLSTTHAWASIATAFLLAIPFAFYYCRTAVFDYAAGVTPVAFFDVSIRSSEDIDGRLAGLAVLIGLFIWSGS